MSDKDEKNDDSQAGATEEESSNRAGAETSTSKSSAASSGESRTGSKAATERSARRTPKRPGDGPRRAAQGTARVGPGRLALAGAMVLAAGAIGGWFAHDAHAKSQLREEAAAAGEDGSCGAWEQAICTKRGNESADCQQAKTATNLLTTAACDVALETVPASLSKLKAARIPCDELRAKLCKDLSKGSPACQLVKDQTPGFLPDKCESMLQSYDEVLEQLKMVEEQMQQRGMGGPRMGGPPGAGGPSGAVPPSQRAVPMRKATPPQGAAPPQ